MKKLYSIETRIESDGSMTFDLSYCENLKEVCWEIFTTIRDKRMEYAKTNCTVKYSANEISQIIQAEMERLGGDKNVAWNQANNYFQHWDSHYNANTNSTRNKCSEAFGTICS